MSEADSIDSFTTSPPKKEKVLTGRGVTLSMLMGDGVVEAGKDCLSIEYLVSISRIFLYGKGRGSITRVLEYFGDVFFV